MKQILRVVIALYLLPHFSSAQVDHRSSSFPDLIMTNIPGAPKLGKPILIVGSKYPVIGEGHGLAAPAYWDWDGDGLSDLLIGEFGSGIEYGKDMGNFIRVFRNVGTESEPKFTGDFDYARPSFQILTNGTPYSVDQSCCIGFTPLFVDLDNDGHQDIITGQYYGEVSWFRGSKDGFIDGKALPQEGNPREIDKKKFIINQPYWLYSAASFGDFTNDGKLDMIVGGLGSLRISKNIGTVTEPQFAERKPLLDIKGHPLKIYEYKINELAEFKSKEPYVAGDPKLSPIVVDWDQDGILDLLVTNSYSRKGLSVVDFFRGVKVGDDHRFEDKIPLITRQNGEKAFPGSSPHVFVTDWNKDGSNDLLIGISVITLHGKFSDQLSWNWEKDLMLFGAGKDPANIKSPSDGQLQAYMTRLPKGISMEDYVTIRHQGYVYVLLGENEKR